MKYIIATLGLLLANGIVSANDDFTPSKFACSGIEKKIDNINSKMRQGYTSRQGESYREQLRQLKENRRICKKEGFNVK